tara:strand:- start:39 stop:503 length:465 start_codon:yes stop_codon:yes gene_type:complete
MNESELLKEIEDLDKTIITNKLYTRGLRESDWDTLVAWWDTWPNWTAPAKGFLPENGTGGLMVEKNGVPIVAGFIYQTNSDGVLLEWVISNPEYKERDRKDAIEKLLIDAEDTIKAMGYKYIFSIGRNKHLINTHKKLGWFVDDKPSHEILKNL